ncbi:MAG: M20/M25/M40 family metallo-hydrolase [Acidobacteria bacterium]|nr:M20/M25/M40 family metallo-hydrolase [Acidobacteriota bacterium]
MALSRKEFLSLSGKSALAAQAARLGFFAFLSEPSGFSSDVLESSTVKKVHAYIDDHLDEHVGKIQEFLRQPSVSSWDLGIKECAGMLVDYFKQLRCKEANLVPTDGNPGVWAWYDGGAKKTVSRYFMYDTQPFNEKEWSSPPLAANLAPMAPFRSVIIARGAINSKGPLRAFLNALEAIIAVEGKLPVNIMFTCDGEEEQGSPHFHQVLAPYIDRLKICSAHLDPDPSQNREGQVSMWLGNKGICYVELEVSGRRWGRGPQKMPIHSSRKAILESPVWRLVQALHTMYNQSANRILIDGYYDAITPPTEEEEMLIATLIEKFKDRAFASERENVKAWMGDWSDEDAIRHLTFDTTLNIDGIWGGYTGPGVATILPEKAACKIDSRLVPNQGVKDQEALIRRHLDEHGFSDIEMRSLAGGDEWSRTSVREPAVQSVLSVYKKYGIEPAIWPRSAGSSPEAQYTRPPLNLPAVSGGLGHGSRAHAVDEYFVIEGNDKVAGLAECEKSMVDILYAYANWPE